MNEFNYKGYYTKIRYDAKENWYSGKLEDIRDLVNFGGENIEEFEKDFKAAVEEYLDFCKEVGKVPDVPARRQENFEFENSVQLAAI